MAADVRNAAGRTIAGSTPATQVAEDHRAGRAGRRGRRAGRRAAHRPGPAGRAGRALACEPDGAAARRAGVGPGRHETERFAVLLRELAAEGVAVVLVEHDMKLVMEVCDAIHVLDFGQIIAGRHAGGDPGRRRRARGLPRCRSHAERRLPSTPRRQPGDPTTRRCSSCAASEAALRAHRGAARHRPGRARRQRRRRARPERRRQDHDAAGLRPGCTEPTAGDVLWPGAGSTAPRPTTWPAPGCASSPRVAASSRT